MIKFEHTQVFGWEPAIRGMRNPKNSWGRIDSLFVDEDFCDDPKDMKLAELCGGTAPIIKENDMRLMKQLRDAGPVHRKYLRMIQVYVDITAPLYWWKEFDTYKIGTVANSCSTMHKIAAKEFTLDDFSHEHLDDISMYSLESTISFLNASREEFNMTKEKHAWWQMIQLLPSSYNQKRTVMMSYETLANIMQPDCRLHHKLDEWNLDKEGSFCQWVTTLPYSELITGERSLNNAND